MIVGVLLAAGRGERFGGAKLLAPLPGTDTVVAVASLRALNAAVPATVAVVRPADDDLAARLAAEGARVIRAERAHEGMGASLATGIAAAGDATGYVVALADMPWIRPATIARVASALEQGATIAVPCCGDARGHPVGFAASLRAGLLALGGDEGAKRLMTAHAAGVVAVDVDDPGIFRDVDVPADLGG